MEKEFLNNNYMTEEEFNKYWDEKWLNIWEDILIIFFIILVLFIVGFVGYHIKDCEPCNCEFIDGVINRLN